MVVLVLLCDIFLFDIYIYIYDSKMTREGKLANKLESNLQVLFPSFKYVCTHRPSELQLG